MLIEVIGGLVLSAKIIDYYEQHDMPACIGGQLTEPKLQKTQQSPFLGFKTVSQFEHL